MHSMLKVDHPDDAMEAKLKYIESVYPEFDAERAALIDSYKSHRNGDERDAPTEHERIALST